MSEQTAAQALSAARRKARMDRGADLYRRMVNDNLQQLDEAGERIARKAYGAEDWLDDVRAIWLRSFRSGLDLVRVMWGFAPSGDDPIIVPAEIEVGSQASGPIVFALRADRDLHLALKHLHQIEDGEVVGTPRLGPSNFQFTPPVLPVGGPSNEVTLELVGLNQYGADGKIDVATELPKGQYIGFIGSTIDRFRHLAILVLTVIDARMPSVGMS